MGDKFQGFCWNSMFRADSSFPAFPGMSRDTLSSLPGESRSWLCSAGHKSPREYPGKGLAQGSLGLPSRILGRFGGGFCGSHPQFWKYFWGSPEFLPKFQGRCLVPIPFGGDLGGGGVSVVSIRSFGEAFEGLNPSWADLWGSHPNFGETFGVF